MQGPIHRKAERPMRQWKYRKVIDAIRLCEAIHYIGLEVALERMDVFEDIRLSACSHTDEAYALCEDLQLP